MDVTVGFMPFYYDNPQTEEVVYKQMINIISCVQTND